MPTKTMKALRQLAVAALGVAALAAPVRSDGHMNMTECAPSWVDIVQGMFGSMAIPAVFNASLAFEPYASLGNDTATFDGATWFVPTDDAVAKFAQGAGLTIEDLLGPALNTSAGVVWTHGCSPGTEPDGESCDKMLMDDMVMACNSTASIVDGPYKNCDGPTFYSIDSVLSTGPLCPTS